MLKSQCPQHQFPPQRECNSSCDLVTSACIFDQPLQGLCLLFFWGQGGGKIFFNLSTFIGACSFYCKIHNIKFAILTIVKCTVQWHYEHSHCCATISISRTWPPSQTETVPIKQLPPQPLASNPAFAFFPGNLTQNLM